MVQDPQRYQRRMVLGRTGLEVNRMGFGGIPIQRVDEAEAIATVRHAIDCGIDFIDTARAYTTSEQRIGRALQETDKKVALASKSQVRTADGIRREIETSLKNLQRDQLDLYQCHYVKNEQEYTQVISADGALQGLLRARQEGLINHIGLTSHSLDLIDKVLDDELFDTVMVCFSLLETAAENKIIPKALQKNIGVIAMKPFSGGVLADARLCLKYVLSHPGILVIPGVEDTALFDANWQVFQGSWQLDENEQGSIDSLRREYDKSFCRRCDYCQPCSEEIPIQLILGMRYAIQRFGDAILQKPWMEAGIEHARRCSECGECMERCPYDLPIPDMIRKNLHWLDEEYRPG
jgi:predicted aldo/keto reductase-like oxidoreductase